MDDRTYQTARELILEALRLPVGERAGFLDQRCGSDATLRRVAGGMLAQQESATIAGGAAEELFESAHAAREQGTADPVQTFAPLKKLGRFTVKKLLGEGGMGVVYLAEQDQPRRTVALKVIRPGLLTPRLLRRFELESQVLARLQHPGIAQVFDAGTADTGAGPQPYFAMELIEGETLAEYVSRAKPPIRARIELFCKICDAVQHAHTKGVVHRDLKPSNILITGACEPKILDFGVARATDSDGAVTLDTIAGQLVGTVPYMSPEQIAGEPGDVDTRSDVYTLGVILYEVLSGRMPHDLRDKTVPEAARVITTDEPRALAMVNRECRGDLDTIARRALEKDRARRYQSASDLAADLRRFLSDEPILARPPSTVYQWTKFARRNRQLVTGIVAAFVLLILGIAGTSWQAKQATAGRNAAIKAEKAAAEEAARAQAVTLFLTDMLSAVDPEIAQGREPKLGELLDTAAAQAGGLKDKPSVEAAVRDAIGRTYRNLGKYEQGQIEYLEVVRLCEATDGPQAKTTLQARRNLAGIIADRGRFSEAQELYATVLEIYERVYGKDDPDTAMTSAELGRVYQETGGMAKGETLIRAAIAVCEPAWGSRRREVQTLYNNLGIVLKDLGRFEESVEMLRKAYQMRADTVGPDHPDSLTTLNNLGASLQRLGRNEEAAGIFEDGLARRRRVFGERHVSTMISAINLGQFYVTIKEYGKAEPLLREAYEVFTQQLGDSHTKTLIVMNALAFLCEDLGRAAEAEDFYKRVVQLRRDAAGGKDPETWSAMNNYAMFLQSRGDFGPSLTQFEELMQLVDAGLPEDHYLAAIFRNNYGDCLRAAGRTDEARRELTRSRDVLAAKLGKDHARTLRAEERLARLGEPTSR